MNVCFFCRGFTANGGIGRVTSILANYLAESGKINVFLCSFSDERAQETYPINDKCHQEYLYDRRITMTKAFLMGHAVKRLANYIACNDIDIIVSCGVIYNPLTVLAARKCGIKVVCWEHTNPTNKSDYRFQDQSRVFGAKLSDRNILLTHSALEIYQHRFPRARNVQIYNPVDPELSRHTGNYDGECHKIISVGRLRPQKNFDRLLEIAAESLPKLPGWTWDIFGEGELHEHLQKKCDALGLQDRVCFMGQVGDLYDRYKDYAFIVMTSDYEGFPMTLLEGAANGLPMVSFDVPTGPNEIIQNGTNGFLCSQDRMDEMVSAIVALGMDDDKRRDMSRESRSTARRFEVDRICQQWMELFEELLK
ncbi:MAG: glycosyltransferase family 4 protein [Eubacteriales bacterium]|nr:glycosyltransferase family 4 protein [Eubacteriales bacterium]